MKHRQGGATFLGILTILLILGTAGYAALRLVPTYLDFMKVSRALEQVRDEHGAIDTNSQMIRDSLARRWLIEDIKGVSWKDVEISREGNGYNVRAAYNVEQQFIANVYLLTKFDKSVMVQQ